MKHDDLKAERYKRLKQIRSRMEYTQAEMADALGVAATTYCQWETGKKPLDDARAEQICATFDVDKDWFDFEVGRMFRRRLADPLPDEELGRRTRLASAKTFLQNATPEYRAALFTILRHEFER